MRKIYYFFILFFTVMIILDVLQQPGMVSYSEDDELTPQSAGLVSRESLTLFNGLDTTREQQTPDTLTWKLLGVIKYVKKPHPDYPEGVMFPVVNSTLKGKSKKKITISGFIIPIDNTSYALSKNVFASCFFCGQAGPETIMGIKFKGSTPKLKTDQYVTLEGFFRYNDNDVEDWIYHIDDAVIVKGK